MKTFKQFLLEREYQIHNNSTINEMSNYGKEDTKLPCVVYLSNRIGVNHGPRIKVNADYGDRWSGKSFSITITDVPVVIGDTAKVKQSDIETIKDWIRLNKNTLLAYWNEQITARALDRSLKEL